MAHVHRAAEYADRAGLHGRLRVPARREAGGSRSRHPGGDDLLRGGARPDRDAGGDRGDRAWRDRLGLGRHVPRDRVRWPRAARAGLLLLPARRARLVREDGPIMTESPVAGVHADEITRLQEVARQIRLEVIKAVYHARAGHLGGPLSAADMLAALYFHVMRIRPDEPAWPDRDRFVLSKGHSSIGLYATMALRGYFPVEELALALIHISEPTRQAETSYAVLSLK